jgi:aryl-alcohol dehydrogenase-like predicted oxidoreductase
LEIQDNPQSSSATGNTIRIPGRATAEGTRKYASRLSGRAANGHFRETSNGLTVSSIGIGTYLGEPDPETDRGYTESVIAAVEAGANLIDTAINYRFQRSERSIGSALRRLVSRGFGREELVICTKAGFLTTDGDMPDDANAYFEREFLSRGIFSSEDVAAGCHCMKPSYLADQLERSRSNLGIESIDIFYLHNPETQLGEISPDGFRSRIREAFAFLESAVADGKIGAYGLATWTAFREDSRSHSYISVEAIVEIAREVAGDNHHFRFVQLPFNLAMPEGITKANQVVGGKTIGMVQAARPLGLTLIASAALLQGQLTRNLPQSVHDVFKLPTDAECALQFVRSAPGIASALVGMSSPEHVPANLSLVAVDPVRRDQFLRLFGHKP